MIGKSPAIALAACVLAGCTDTEIDSGKAETFLRDNVPGALAADCPDGVEAEQGETFECDLEYDDGRRATVTVHIRSDDGQIAVGPNDVRPAR